MSATKLRSTESAGDLATVVMVLLAYACFSVAISRDAFARNNEIVDKTALLQIYVIRPITSIMILPDTAPDLLPGNRSPVISVIAAPGEYEPASFVLRPLVDLTSVRATVTEIKTESGNLLPASSVDIRVVKCWYQAEGAWVTENRLSLNKVLVPELLLHDDRLVKVDYEKKANYLKLPSSAQKEEYVCISERPQAGNKDPHNPEIYAVAPGIGLNAAPEEFAVKDSLSLLPFDISAGKNKQLWLTVHVPGQAKPGLYLGRINLSSSQGSLGVLVLKLRVLPFKLAEPRTYYDLSKPFVSSIYYRGYLDPMGKGSANGDIKSEQQLLAEFRNMFEHGVINPMLCTPYYDDEKLFRKTLQIRKEAGIVGPLYDGNGGFLGAPQDQKALQALQAKVRKILDIAKQYGVPEIYFSGMGEVSGKQLEIQRNAWRAVHQVGGKVNMPGSEDCLRVVGDLLDLLVWSNGTSVREAREWHARGHQILSYANPQPGLENPAIYRRNYGLHLWKSEYDGACSYAYQVGAGGWNDFNDLARDVNFTYPTVDGVIDTIAWEGYREGIDDIRYATTLRLEIEKAKRGMDAGTKTVARRAEQYLEDMDTSRKLYDKGGRAPMRTAEYLELLDPSEEHDLARLNMINYILRLTADSISEGLVGYWSFDENNGEVAHDKSGMSNDGAIHGAKWTPGRIGPALKFGAAGSHVDFGNDPTLHATDAFTIEAWINWTGDYSGADTAWAAVLKDSQYFMGGRIRSASPKLSFFLRVWDKDTGRWEPPADSDYIADPNVWYHVVATYGDELLKVYVNGEPKGTGRKRFAPAASEPLIMGRGIEMPFAGMLDEVRIYNRALSADEIARRYRSLMNQK